MRVEEGAADIHSNPARPEDEVMFLSLFAAMAAFHQAGTGCLPQSRFDMVTVNLADHTMVAN